MDHLAILAAGRIALFTLALSYERVNCAGKSGPLQWPMDWNRTRVFESNKPA